MKTMMIICAMVLTSCATRSAFVLQEQTGEWSVFRHQADSVLDPLTLSVFTPQEHIVEWFSAMDMTNVNSRTTKAFRIESVNGHEIEVLLLNGGESYEVNVIKDGKGFTHTFDEDGKLLGSGEYQLGYEKPQNQQSEGIRR